MTEPKQPPASAIPDDTPVDNTGQRSPGDRDPAIDAKLTDAYALPGYAPEFDPEEAERAGAFREDALTDSDALEAGIDVPPDKPTSQA